jgi:hypothetical protein
VADDGQEFVAAHRPTTSVGRSDPVKVFATSCKARSPVT